MTLAVTQLYSGYDAQVANLLHMLTHGGRPVLHVFATPERAFAQVERKLKNRPDEAQRVFPMPFLSLERLSETFDPKRASRARIRRLMVSKDGTRYAGMKFPIPVNLLYQISIWTKQIRDITDLIVQWFQLFDHTPLRYLTVNHPLPMGERLVAAITREVTSVPMIPEAEKQRVIRRVITLEVGGWIIYKPDFYGIVEKVSVDFRDSDDVDTDDGDCLEGMEVTEDTVAVADTCHTT